MARQLALELINRPSLEVSVVGLEDHFFTQDAPSWGTVPIHCCQTVWPRGLGFSPEVRKSIKATRPDVVHLHNSWYVSLASAASAAINCSAPYVVTVHGSLDEWALSRGRFKKALAARAYHRRVLNHADRVHVLSAAEEQSLRRYGVTASAVVIPNGVCVPVLPAAGSRDQHNKSRDQHNKLIYIGRVTEKKNLLSLVRAWGMVATEAKRTGWTLEIVGWSQAGYDDLLRSLVASLDLADCVVIRGGAFGADKDALLRSADAFVLPSFSEGQPLAALEASAYRLPVLMTPECNLGELFTVGAAYAIGTDPASIADGLLQLFNRPRAMRSAAGDAGRAYVEKFLSWRAVGDEIVGMYERAIGGAAVKSAPPS